MPLEHALLFAVAAAEARYQRAKKDEKPNMPRLGAQAMQLRDLLDDVRGEGKKR